MYPKLLILFKSCTKQMFIATMFITVFSVCFLYQIRQLAINRTTNKSIIKYKYEPNNITCFKEPERVLRMADENFKPSNKNIYFVETSCKGGLNSRQACSIESAARAHPNRSVLVLVTGPLSKPFMKGNLFSRMVTELNIEFVRINVTDYSRGTPLEDMFKKEVLKKSWWPVVHTSDVLRILTLYKYGGIYFDLDVIVLKSFDSLPANFIVYSNNCILAVSNDVVGKNFSEIAVRDLAKTYSPSSFVYNGPLLMMRALEKICDKGKKMNRQTCHGFDVLGIEKFFPLPYQNWYKYMQDWRPNKPMDLYTHHVWNFMGYKAHVPKNSFYAKLAKQYCPIVFDIYGDKFGL